MEVERRMEWKSAEGGGGGGRRRKDHHPPQLLLQVPADGSLFSGPLCFPQVFLCLFSAFTALAECDSLLEESKSLFATHKQKHADRHRGTTRCFRCPAVCSTLPRIPKLPYF